MITCPERNIGRGVSRCVVGRLCVAGAGGRDPPVLVPPELPEPVPLPPVPPVCAAAAPANTKTMAIRPIGANTPELMTPPPKLRGLYARYTPHSALLLPCDALFSATLARVPAAVRLTSPLLSTSSDTPPGSDCPAARCPTAPSRCTNASR